MTLQRPLRLSRLPLPAPGAADARVPAARTLMADVDGRLTVLEAAAWMTIDGDGEDRFLRPGESVELRRGQRAVIEAWSRGADVCLAWQPARQRGHSWAPSRVPWSIARLASSSAAASAPPIRCTGTPAATSGA